MRNAVLSIEPDRRYHDLSDTRRTLLNLGSGLVEDVRGDEGRGFSADFQIALPYRGLFVWQVGDDEIVGDPNQVLFVKGGEAYRVKTRGFAELIITPHDEVVSELKMATHPLFRRRAFRADPHLQSFRTRFLHWARDADPDPLRAEELMLKLLRAAMQQDDRRGQSCGATTARLIRRTKEILQAQLSERIRLTDVARSVGASPAYLTDLFTRVEGLSLHQYLTRLRLAHALVELPHTDDLTTLALDLGFSSHSHFTYAFRRGFGCTPSEFRKGVRPSLFTFSTARRESEK